MSQTQGHPKCHREGDGYFFRTHRSDCNDRKCRGCEPCQRDERGTPVRHCEHRRNCNSHLEYGEHACPECLARIRNDLDGIVRDQALMVFEAEFTGVESEAADLAGPVANVITSRWRRVNAAHAGGWIEETDWTNPGVVLGEWERMIREDLGHDSVTMVSDTLSASAAYLGWVLTDLARDEDQALALAELADAMRRTRSHLELVRHDGSGAERGAPCPACSDGLDPEGDEAAPRLLRKYADWDSSGARDSWRCPRDSDHQWSEADYRLRIADEYLDHAKWLTAAHLALLGVKQGTLRQWAARGQLPRKLGSNGRWLYDADVACALNTPEAAQT